MSKRGKGRERKKSKTGGYKASNDKTVSEKGPFKVCDFSFRTKDMGVATGLKKRVKRYLENNGGKLSEYIKFDVNGTNVSLTAFPPNYVDDFLKQYYTGDCLRKIRSRIYTVER